MRIRININECHYRTMLCLAVLACAFLPAMTELTPTAVSAQQPAVGNIPPNARITEREVIAVQVELRRLGILKTGISAKLDEGTRNALKEYQRKNGLPLTGKIDRETYQKLGLPYPAPAPESSGLVQQVGGTVKEGTRYGLEKAWDAGSLATSKSKDAAAASWDGLKFGGRAAQRKADSMIRRNDDDTAKDISDLFLERRDWSGVNFTVKEGMVTLKIPPGSPVNVGAMVYEVRKIAGVRSVFVIIL